MKKGVVSLAAVLMVLASLATPSYAGKLHTDTYVGQNFTLTYSVADGVAGGQLATRFSIRVNADASEQTLRFVGWEIAALNSSRSGFRALPVNKTKSLAKSFAIPERLPAGTYNVQFSVQVADELKTFTVPITIAGK